MSKNLHTTLSFLFVTYFFASTNATRFIITNNCPFVVWAAAVPGGGRQLNPGQTWPLDVSPATTKTSSHIWARTGCRFDPSGRGRCESGDCDGVLECQSYGRAPYTLAEYTLNQDGSDFFDITLVLGFNVPMEFSPTSPQCRRGAVCAADINGPCPMELRDPGGCNHPCTVFSNDQFCCTSAGICEPTSYSKFFKDLCPNVSTYAYDDQTETFTCPTGTNYKVVFCPN